MATLTKPCPNCGEQMSTESQTCAHCYLENATHKGHRTNACPSCGGVKGERSALCFSCSKGKSKQTYVHKGHPRLGKADFDPKDIDPNWAVAFTGLCVGEGSVQMTYRTKGLPSPSLSIHMRLDEKPLLLDIQKHIGGWITLRTKPTKPSAEGYLFKPQATWGATGFQKVKPILELLLLCPLPAKKVKEFRHLLEYVNWRETIGAFPSEADKRTAEWYFQALRDMRIFKVQD